MSEQERYEEDKYNLLHQIVFNAEIQEWVLVEKYKNLYRDIYGSLPGEDVIPPSQEAEETKS